MQAFLKKTGNLFCEDSKDPVINNFLDFASNNALNESIAARKIGKLIMTDS